MEEKLCFPSIKSYQQSGSYRQLRDWFFIFANDAQEIGFYHLELMVTLLSGEITPVQERAQELWDFRLPKEAGGLLLGELQQPPGCGAGHPAWVLWDPGIWDPGIWPESSRAGSGGAFESFHGELEPSHVSSGIWFRDGHGEVEQSNIMALRRFFFPSDGP